jgi:hypothetical protein
MNQSNAPAIKPGTKGMFLSITMISNNTNYCSRAFIKKKSKIVLA